LQNDPKEPVIAEEVVTSPVQKQQARWGGCTKNYTSSRANVKWR
jgi:hypothetical protein